MLKWTVSRSLSTSSSTPHVAPAHGKAVPRRPFRDLSNTPPTPGSRPKTNAVARNAHNAATARPTSAGRRRSCRSNGADLRVYFQATKPNLRPGKRQSASHESRNSPGVESYYQSTPRVDADIGPLTLFPGAAIPRGTTAMTLPADPTALRGGDAIAATVYNRGNAVNEARANLQSHVSDFFQQISVAASPEDVMQADSVPLSRARTHSRDCGDRIDLSAAVGCVPAARLRAGAHARCCTPYRAKIAVARTCGGGGVGLENAEAAASSLSPRPRQTPLAAKLSDLRLDYDLFEFENVDNTVTEFLDREQETSGDVKMIAGATPRAVVADGVRNATVISARRTSDAEEHRRTSGDERNLAEERVSDALPTCDEVLEDEGTCRHNDSSVSSASQLLEDPSPMSWAFRSPSNDFDDRFTLRRQRGIRRKRQQKGAADGEDASVSRKKRAKGRFEGGPSPEKTGGGCGEREPLAEAINLDVKKCSLETDLDSSFDCKNASVARAPPFRRTPADEEADRSGKTHSWELDSPKSSLPDDFGGSKSFLKDSTSSATPEAPLVATVRRCLKYSPESEPSGHGRGSIEIELSVVGENIHVNVIRCRDLRRAYEGPVHAYVKASLKNVSGEGVVKRTAVHRATPNPVFHETLVLPCAAYNNNCTSKATSLDIAVWHRDRRARRSELLGCMTLPLPLSQDKEATWHPLEAGSGRNTSTPYAGVPQDCGVSPPPLSKDGEPDNNNSNSEDLTYLRHLELEPMDPLTGLPLHPGFTARGGRTPCTITRRLLRQSTANPVPWGFSLSWGRPPKVERVDPGSPAERAGLRPGDHVVFVEATNVVTRPRDEILSLIQAATNQLILEVHRKGGAQATTQRPSSVNVTLHPAAQVASANQHSVAFTTEVFPSLTPDASPEEELSVRETRYWGSLKSGQARFHAPLMERVDILSGADRMILFQNLEELLKISEEIRDEGGGVESYLSRVPTITAAYRRYLSGLQRACCLLVALRRNTAFAKLVCEPAVPHKRKPDLTGVLLLPLEHYREMTRLIGLASPRNCQEARDLAQGYREATANAGVMEPPRDTGRPLLSLQEVESRLVFARCAPFTLALPGRQWLFGGALAKVEGRGRLQPSWALLLTDLLVFARVSRDRVLFVTEEPLRLSNIAEACFTVRKRPTEFRLQVAVSPNGSGENGHLEMISSGGCSPHSRPKRRVLILRAPSPELKAVWHNLLQRQIIYVNTGYGCTPGLGSPVESPATGSNFTTARASVASCQYPKSAMRQRCRREEDGDEEEEEDEQQSGESLDSILKNSTVQGNNNHLAQWVRNSHQIPPPDHEGPLEEWTPEELAARAPKEVCNSNRLNDGAAEENATANSDAEQQSTASSASLSTVRSNGYQAAKKNGVNHLSAGRGENSTGSISICRRCHRSGCPTPPLTRDPFSPLPPKISVLPPTPDLCTRHRLRNGGSHERDSPNCTPADGNTEDGSEDDLDYDGEPPYRALRRFGTMSSLDQDDELDEQQQQQQQQQQADEENHDVESSPPSGLRAWTVRASNYVVSKMVLLEQFGEGVGGYLLHPPVPPERTEFSLDANDEEGTTSGATSGDDIWGTPTSGGPDDESFAAGLPPSNGIGDAGTSSGEDNYGLNLTAEDDPDPESDNEDNSLPELSMDQLLGGVGSSNGGGGSLSTSLRCFVARRRLEPLPEEEDSPSGGGKHQVGWW